MRYRKLPVVVRLEAIEKEQGEDACMEETRRLLAEVAAHEGFQLILEALREIESRALAGLTNQHTASYHAGELNAIQSLRIQIAGGLLQDEGTEDVAAGFDSEWLEEATHA
jgi:hypothetical protein